MSDWITRVVEMDVRWTRRGRGGRWGHGVVRHRHWGIAAVVV